MLMRLILIGILIFIVLRLLRFLSSSGSRTARTGGQYSSSQVSDMVQDPHCGVYIARKDAFSARTQDGLLFFCSEECCRNYLQKK